MSEKKDSLTDPNAIREQVQEAVAKESSHRPVDVEPSEIPPDDTEIAPDFFPGITVSDVEDAFRWKNVGDGALAIKLLKGKICFDAIAEKPYRYNHTHWLRDKNSNWRKALFQVADLYAIRSRHYTEQAKHAEELYQTTVLEEMQHAEEFDEKTASKEEKQAEKLRERAFKVKERVLAREVKRSQKIADAWIGRVNSCRDMAYLRKVWDAALSGDGSLAISGDEWNKYPTLLPCKNVVVDLETGKHLKSDPFQYFNRATDFPFHSLHDEAPFWMETLSKALMRNEALIDYFDHMVGFAATGMQTKDFFLAYGPKGDNAKSVVFEWLRKAIGDFAGTLKVQALLEERFMRSADGPSPSMLKLRGLRMAVTSEADKKHQFDMGKIKALTSGGDRLEARGINAVDIVEFNPELTLVLHSNFLPSATGSDEAFFKRVKVLPFRAMFIAPKDGPEDVENHIYHAKPRTVVDAILAKEAPGIMAYVVRCAIKALKAGDMPPAPSAVLAETNQYRADQDMVGHFLRECTDPDKNNKEQMKDIYFAFRKWCIEEQSIVEKKVWSQNALGKDLKQRRGIERIESNVTYYRGLRIKDEWRKGHDQDATGSFL